MMPNYCNHYTLCFEHDRLCKQGSLLALSGMTSLPPAIFDSLFAQLPIGLKRDWLGNQAILKTTHYVGIIQSTQGHVLEILPKTARHTVDPIEMRLILLNMLVQLPDTPFKTLPHQSLMQLAKVPLLQLTIQQALHCFLQLSQHGFKHHYTTIDDHLPVLRGRLQVQQQVRHNHSNQARFFTTHDDYLPDCAENRLIRLALDFLAKHTLSSINQQHLHELQQRMQFIKPSRQPNFDWRQASQQRQDRFYRDALAWAWLIIQGMQPLPVLGQQSAFSLLFDMNKLFENFVAVRLQQQLPINYRLKFQYQGNALLRVNSQPYQRLKPDLLLLKNHEAIAILDAKWKIRQGSKFTQIKPDDQELYQMFAYAAAYLPKGGDVYLVYPRTKAFTGGIERAVFEHIRDASVHLHMVPFCLADGKVLDVPF